MTEFVRVMSRKVETVDQQDVMRAFAAFSHGAPRGYVKLDVIERALYSYGPNPMSKSEAQRFVQQVERALTHWSSR
jgi:Ca2+-binding EF-hand superfamily protein